MSGTTNSKRKAVKTIKMQQILAAPFNGTGGLTYSMFGLGRDGVVYRYDTQCEGWIPWPNKIANCRSKHPNKK